MVPLDSGRQVSLSPPEFQILLALADGEKHGYGIMQEVGTRTAGRTRMGPGTLYGAIKRMLRAGLLEEAEERLDPKLDDQRRRYYRLTDAGRRLAVAEAERMAELVREAYDKRLLTKRLILGRVGG
ncbi:MAG TPA: PadR family transcriptional regulator [Gemmataceae bacterium]|nr:PadR family transcriptional regulator [Gemmataceae bacterium]